MSSSILALIGLRTDIPSSHRQLGKKPVMTEEQIAYIASQEDPEAGKTVRRTRTTRKFT